MHRLPQTDPTRRPTRRCRLLGATGATLLTCAAVLATALPARGGEDADPPLWLRLPGLSASGGIGLPGMTTALSGAPWQLRAGLHIMGFSQDNFLITQDHNALVAGSFQLDATLGRHVELWLMVRGLSNRNERTADMRADPTTIVALGDLGAGLNIHAALGAGIRLAVQPVLHMSAGRSLGPDTSTVSPGVDVLASADLRRLSSRLPLLLHVGLGYLHDRSSNLLTDNGCAPATNPDDCANSRLVTAFAYGVHQPRVRFALGADVALPIGHLFALGPLLEYHVEAVTSGGDDAVRGVLKGRVDDDLLESRVAQWLVIGARLHTPVQLTVDLGMLAGLTHPGWAMGPPMPEIAGYGGLSFSTDMLPRRPVVAAIVPGPAPGPGPGIGIEERPPIGQVPQEPARPREGQVRGVVRDRQSGAAVSGAVVRFPGRQVNALLTDERGEFETHSFPPGGLVMEVSRDDYEPQKVEAVVVPGERVQADVSLLPRMAAPATIRVDVVDEKGQPLPAQVSLMRDGQKIDAPPDIAGGFLGQAPSGGWVVHVESDGYFTREQQVTLQRGARHTATLVLHKRPAVSSVRLGNDQIIVRGGIAFEPGGAQLLPEAHRVLDEVADLLLKERQYHLVRIEGHMDSVGKPQVSQQLSEERARAVKAYLVKQGVGPERLVAEGYGSTQPLAPNLTPASRAKNRRIVFRILDR